MNKIEKNKILKIVSECAIKYKENLTKKTKLEVILKNNELLSKIDTKNLNLNNNPNKQ